MRKRMKVLLWVMVALVVVALFAITAAKRLRTEQVESVKSVQEAEGIPVDYIVTRVCPVGDWRRFVGIAEGYDQVDLTTEYRTRVSAVHVKVGDTVAKGKVIVSLDEFDPARMAVNLGSARSQYDTARRDSLRMEELFKSGAISEQQLDYARTETEHARAVYNTARRAVELDSPISGVVTALYVQGGDYADAGQVLATVASYKKMRIHLDVSAGDRSAIEPGQEVRLAIGKNPPPTLNDSPEKTWLGGTVEDVSLSADPETRLFRVDLAVDNPERLLKPGSLVSPEILVAISAQSPAVPSSSILRQSDRDVVYVISGNDGDYRAAVRTVLKGVANGELSAVAEGLKAGERVVVWGHSKLRDNARVKLHDDVSSKVYEAIDRKGEAR